jgi:CspA family cold shock protein
MTDTTTTTGTVTWFGTGGKNYGFIQPDDGGPQMFCHISAVGAAGLRGLEQGDPRRVFGRDRREKRQASCLQSESNPMIPAFVVDVLIGGIIGWAIAACRHARIDDAPPTPNVGISCIGLGNGKGGLYLDPYYVRLLKPILERLGREVM